MKKVKLQQLMTATQFKLSVNDRDTYVAESLIALNLKGGIERLCKRKIADTAYGTPYMISADRFVYVDEETNILVYDE